MQTCIGRQVIIDRNQEVLGYELLFRHAADATEARFDDDFAAGVEVMTSLLTRMGTDWLLGDKLAVINVTSAMLDSEFINLLPPARVVLDVVDKAPISMLVERCRRLHAKGFALAFSDLLPTPANQPLLELADYVYFDIRHQNMTMLGALVKSLGVYGVKLIAKKVETPGEFRSCHEMGFHYFQGYHFARPETLSTRSIDPSYGRMIDLLNLVRTNAEATQIEAAIKSDVALSSRLFQYVNSAGFGMAARPVYSIRQAVAMMGYRQLYRWLSLLIVTSAGAATPPALARTALTRGRLLELLGSLHLSSNERDSLFIVGVFSLLDVILDTPMDSLLRMLNPPEAISEALRRRGGPYGHWLELVEACEGTDAEHIYALTSTVGLTAEEVNEAHLNALAWVEELEM